MCNNNDDVNKPNFNVCSIPSKAIIPTTKKMLLVKQQNKLPLSPPLFQQSNSNFHDLMSKQKKQHINVELSFGCFHVPPHNTSLFHTVISTSLGTDVVYGLSTHTFPQPV